MDAWTAGYKDGIEGREHYNPYPRGTPDYHEYEAGFDEGCEALFDQRNRVDYDDDWKTANVRSFRGDYP